MTATDAGGGVVAVAIPGVTALQGAAANFPWVDLRDAPYHVTANDVSKAAANTAACKQAMLDYASVGAQFNFPPGTVYLDKDVTSSNRASIILDGLIHSGPKVFKGQGRDVTTLQFQGLGNSGEWAGIKTYQGFRNFTISDMTLQFGTVTNPDPGKQMHLLESTNNTSGLQTTRTFHAFNLRFGACIGAGFRTLGEDGANHQVENVYVHHCIFETNGIGLGSRSCLEIQRGFRNIEIGHCYFYGAKNSLIDCEETTVAPEAGINIHHCYFDASNSQTTNAVSLGGSGATGPADHCNFSDNTVLQGNVTLTSGDKWLIARNFMKIDGTNAGGDDYFSTPNLYIFQINSDISLIDNYIERSNLAAANLIYLEASAVPNARPSYVTIQGGKLIQNGDGNIIQSEDCDRLKVSGVMMRNTSANAGTYYAVNVRALTYNCSQTSIVNCTLTSTVAKMRNFAAFSASSGFAMNDILLVGNDAANQCTFGVQFDLSVADGSTLDVYPIIQANNFRGATNIWVASNLAAGVVFPIIAGNRGDVCHIVGTVAPASVVTAVQGSRYTRMNGDSTQEFYKSTGIAATGWSSAVVVP